MCGGESRSVNNDRQKFSLQEHISQAKINIQMIPIKEKEKDTESLLNCKVLMYLSAHINIFLEADWEGRYKRIKYGIGKSDLSSATRKTCN